MAVELVLTSQQVTTHKGEYGLQVLPKWSEALLYIPHEVSVKIKGYVPSLWEESMCRVALKTGGKIEVISGEPTEEDLKRIEILQEKIQEIETAYNVSSRKEFKNERTI
jgi:hypothetical protein